MTEGLHRELLLMPNETTSLARVLDACASPHVQRVLSPGGALDHSLTVLSNALQRAAPGVLQTQTGLPVHVGRVRQKSEHGTAIPVCDVDALGVVVDDRNLVDCEACLSLIRGVQPPCPNHCNDGFVERAATPAEVDAGLELGVAFDPCPACNPDGEGTAERIARERGTWNDPYGLDPELPQPGVATVDLLEHDPTVTP